MKPNCSLLFLFICYSFFGCINKTIDFSEINYTFTDPDSLKENEDLQLTFNEYQAMQLDKISEYTDCGYASFYYGDTIAEGKNGRLQIIRFVTDTEKAEFLLSYDIAGNLIDHIRVSFADWQNYHKNYSELRNNRLTVYFIEPGFDNISMGRIADTLKTEYQITPQLIFKEE